MKFSAKWGHYMESNIPGKMIIREVRLCAALLTKEAEVFREEPRFYNMKAFANKVGMMTVP